MTISNPYGIKEGCSVRNSLLLYHTVRRQPGGLQIRGGLKIRAVGSHGVDALGQDLSLIHSSLMNRALRRVVVQGG